MERRKFNRVIFSAPAMLMQGDKQWQTAVIDVSLQGALIDYPDEFEAELELDFQLDIEIEGANRHILMHGYIVHNANHRLGFKVKDIDVESITELRRIVELNLGDETLLKRNFKALSDN
jgi:hypothetical protein